MLNNPMLTPDEYERILAYLRSTSRTPIKDRRIRAITVNPSIHSLPKMRIEVGRPCGNLEPGAPRETVLAIFESASFLVVTPSRGAGEGPPYFFSREDIRRVDYLTEESNDR